MHFKDPVATSKIAAACTMKLGPLTAASDVEFHSELDSHADTCVVGKEMALIIHDFK